MLKGNLELLVMSILARQPRHGYAIIEALRADSADAFDLPEGTLYPVLYRLEAAGLIVGSWSEVGGRRRKSYALTERGMAALQQKRQLWDEFSSAMSAVLAKVPWPGPSSWRSGHHRVAD